MVSDVCHKGARASPRVARPARRGTYSAPMMSRASRRVFVAAAAALTAVAVLPEQGARADGPFGLFVIERSKNANVIHYDAHVAKDGSLVASEPVVAYWIMKAE